jgi:tetratricopeptide (TPR) repeat protein
MAETETEIDAEAGTEAGTEAEKTEQSKKSKVAEFIDKLRALQWPSGAKIRMVIAAAAVVLVIIGIVIYQSRDEGPTPREMLLTALKLIDERDDLKARSEAVTIARKLRRRGYRDADFAGGTEFVLGVASFRSAQGLDETQRERRYLIAANELRKSETLAIDKSRRSEWAFALGSSLYEIGKATEARPLLEEAVESYSPGRIEASVRLVDIYLDLKTEDVLLKAVPLLKTITDTKGLDQSQRDGAYLRSAQVFLALNRHAEAEQALEQVSDDTQGNQGTIVFRAQTLMAEAESTMIQAKALSEQARVLTEQAQQSVKQKQAVEAARLNSEADAVSARAVLQRKTAVVKYLAAMGQLEPVANDVGLEQTFARQASFLLGICAEAIDDVDAAINHFERTAEKYARSQEGVAANLRAADLLRRAGRNEEALNKRYSNALRTVKQPEDFRNRWLSLEQFRGQIRKAWEEWADAHAYQEAITLAGMMTPLFPPLQAREFTARANRRWAEYLDQQSEYATYTQQQKLQRPQRERWRESGKSHAALANEMKTSADYPNALRISAEHYRRGHDFENSLRQWNLFINTRPKAQLAEALVNRGKILMDLDRLDEALLEFQLVIDSFLTDSASFEAQYVLGMCHLEKNELDEAKKVWRAIITSDSLTPAAKQWQLSQVSLGKLMFHTAVMKKTAAQSPRSTLSQTEKDDLLEEAFSRWDEAIHHLELFLAFVTRDSRHPEAVRAKPEARYLLARALRHAADKPQQKLDSAETENARIELRRSMQDLLSQARDGYRTLQSELRALEEIDMLGDLERRLLRDCFFELAHTYFMLAGFGLDSAADNYNKAIVAYQSAANRYQRDPQVILAYIQISKCHERLGEHSYARSSLEQAKVILKQMPDDAFTSNTTSMSKTEWLDWLEWMQSLQQKLTATPKLIP